MDIINEMGIAVNEVRASGGGGKSEVWRQIQADMFNSEVVTINSSEGPALGVAILALVGVGVYPSVVEACDTIIHKVTSQKPIAENSILYSNYHDIYKRLYTALKPEFISLNNLV